MAKITTKNYKIAGKLYECTVWYTTSNKFFLKGFPSEVQRAAQIQVVGFNTEEELYEAHEEGVKKYEEMIAQCKKVIVFRIQAAPPHVEERWSNHNEAKRFPVGVDSTHGYDMGFVITYDVKLMRTVGESFYLHNFDTEDKPYGSGDEIKNKQMYRIIDYTPEREAAFKDLYIRFDKMFMAFVEGFNDAEKFIDAIPTTRQLF